MHARSVRPHKLRKIKTSNGIHGGIHMFSHINIASQATRFAVSVPTQEFHFSPTPQVYMQKIKIWALGCSLNTSIYIPTYILLYQSYPKVNTSHIYINMHI